MVPGDWVRLVAITGLLVLAVLSLARSARSPLARILALLAVDIGGMNVASVVNHVTDSALGGLADAVFSSMAAPIALHFTATFVGLRRTTRAVVAAGYATGGALALASCFAFARATTRSWIEGPVWSVVFVSICVPLLIVTLALLLRHLGAATDVHEKTRTRLLLGAIAVGGALNTADVVTWMASRESHDVGPIGTLVAVALVAVVVFRLRLFDRDPSASAILYAAAMATATVAMYLVVFWAWGHRAAPLLLGTACVTIVAGAALRELVDSTARARAQRDRLAVLGRFAAQMAHDLKNPLAAIVGATRLIEDAPVSPEQQTFLTLVREQADRIGRIVDKYDRLGRVEPVRTPTDLGDVARRVASAQSLTAPGVRFSFETDDPRVCAEVDEDLVAGALENVVRNALEAMPRGGSLAVRVMTRGPYALVRIEDEGEGMDPRRAERAFDDFYTTKPGGSGLGLAFVRRVAHAHGGDVSITSRRGKGTAVELRLPLPRPGL